jgi:hypothetical protein
MYLESDTEAVFYLLLLIEPLDLLKWEWRVP